MSDTCPWEQYPLHELDEKGVVTLGRGNIISKIDIKNNPGGFPIYSSSAKGEGLFGAYGDYMFDEEMITWSVDGGGNLFYRPRHKFSVTNVSGYMRLDTSVLDYQFAHASLALQHSKLTFDYQTKAHPSVIRNLYNLPIPPLPEQKKIAEILSGIDKRITASDNLQKYYLLLLDSVSRDSFKIDAGEIKTLGELAEFKSGRAFKSEELSEDGIKVTRISNLHKPNFPYWRYKGEYNPKIVARDGDILFSWAGVANSINVHRYRGEDSLLNQHIYNFKFDDLLIKEWSYWNLRNMLPKLRESIEGGAGQLHLTKGFIQSLHIPILSRSKMDSLSKCFQSIQTLVEAQKKTSIKLLALKNALLSDLLSGRKRVRI